MLVKTVFELLAPDSTMFDGTRYPMLEDAEMVARLLSKKGIESVIAEVQIDPGSRESDVVSKIWSGPAVRPKKH